MSNDLLKLSKQDRNIACVQSIFSQHNVTAELTEEDEANIQWYKDNVSSDKMHAVTKAKIVYMDAILSLDPNYVF